MKLFNFWEIPDGSSVLFERDNMQEKDGSQVSSLTFVPMKYQPTLRIETLRVYTQTKLDVAD